MLNESITNGFTIIENVFSHEEIDQLTAIIDATDASKPTFRRNADLFAIRQFLKEAPGILPILFTPRLRALVNTLMGSDYFVVKSIYFDKPGNSNWFVPYHQDLTISVNKKIPLDGFGPWTVKHNQFAVQPPLPILQGNGTLRIHLDDNDEHNGALRVIPGSHIKGVYRPETIDWSKETEFTCTIKKGGVLFMRPLLLHASSKTTSNNRRRVIHIEFSNQQLPEPLQWSELLQVPH